MTKEFWVNLPVKDLKKSKDFFTELGFTFKPLPGNREDGACLILGSKSVYVMMFEENMFRSFTDTTITDTSKSNEVLFSIDAENTDEVNILAERVKKAGGKVFAGPAEKDGWMYGFGFSDPDGHLWNVLYMEPSASNETHPEDNDEDSDEKPSEEGSGTPQQKHEMQVP